MERRAVVGGSLLAGLSTLMSPESAEAVVAEQDQQEVSSSIDRLRRTVEDQFGTIYTSKWNGVARIRQQQHTWMRSTQKYPDFIEIGLDVWDNIYDWHVVHQQPLSITRTADGRYTMMFMFTTLLLRPDQATDYVGFAFDADARTPRR